MDPNGAKASTKYYEYTPLHWAARDGREELVRELLRRGSRVEDKTSGGYTALHKACVEGHDQVQSQQCMVSLLKKSQSRQHSSSLA